MLFRPRLKLPTVNNEGASAGSVLRGVGLNNQGLRLRVAEDQPRGQAGPVRGDFVILDPGENIHAPALDPLLHRPTNAREVLAIIRQRHPACVNVANTNSLVLEPAEQVVGEGELKI